MKKLLSALLAVCLLFSVVAVGMSVSAEETVPEIWDGSIATSFASGTGTADDPYIIETASQLAYFTQGTSSTYEQKYIKLANDIYLNDTSDWENWETTAPLNMLPPSKTTFSGNFDGENHTIYGLYCVGGIYGGLFSRVTDGIVKNITFKESFICASFEAGAISAFALGNDFQFINCKNYSTVKIAGTSTEDTYVGGIVGYIYEYYRGYIYDCHNYGKIEGATYAGGISALYYSDIYNSSNHGDVSGEYAGGISGGHITNSGIAYGNTSQCSECYNTGSVTGESAAGGIIGFLNSMSYTNLSGKSYYHVGTKVLNSYNCGTITGTKTAGGICGSVSGYSDVKHELCRDWLKNCYNVGVVSAETESGQIAGHCNENASSSPCKTAEHITGVYYYNPVPTSQYSLGNYSYDRTGVMPMNKSQAKTQETYTDFDFIDIWVMSGNPDYPYPELQNNRQPHDHAYTETVNAEATCTQDGSKTLTCWCGDTYDDIIPASGHSYESTVTSEPTCTEDGLKTLTCSCGDTYTEVIPATGHSHVESVQEATCTTAGLKTYTCSCGDTYTETIPASGHSLVTVTVEATCTEDGETYTQCSTCKTVFGEKEIIPASGHNHKVTVTTKAGCTTAGLKTFTCDCGDTYTENIPATGHALRLVSQANTCTSAGFEYYICDNCGNMIGDTEYLPKLGHNYKKSVVTAATCTAPGEMLYDCDRCDASYTEEIPATGHSFSEWTQTKVPTCTATGTERRDCKNCDEYETRDVAVTAHDWETDYTVDKAATCTEKGSKSIHCKDCSATKSVTEIPSSGHDYKSVTTDPTCTEKGYTTHTCSVCKDSYTDSKVNANGHSYNTVVTAPNCENKGYTTHTCSVCGDNYTDSFVNSTGHNYEESVTTPATCTASGVKTFACDCGDSYTEDIPAIGHSAGDWEHYSGNTYVRRCSVCQTVIDSEVRNSYEISIKNNPGSKTISYGEKLRLTATVANAPEGAKVYWYVDGVKKGEGETFEVSPGEKSVKVTVKLVDSNGETIVNYNGEEASDEQTVNVNSGFFQKLASFFKNLFGVDRTVSQ